MSDVDSSLKFPPPLQTPFDKRASEPHEPFNVSPFTVLDHHHSNIIPEIYYRSTVGLTPSRKRRLQSSFRDFPHQPDAWSNTSKVFDGGDSGRESNDDDPVIASETPDRPMLPDVPCPHNGREAYLLLESARADRRISLARETLALQLVHRNTLVLQYNRMVLERAQNDLRAADQFVGHVRLMIRRSGHTAAFEYAMQEDLLCLVDASDQPCPQVRFPIDVDLS